MLAVADKNNSEQFCCSMLAVNVHHHTPLCHLQSLFPIVKGTENLTWLFASVFYYLISKTVHL